MGLVRLHEGWLRLSGPTRSRPPRSVDFVGSGSLRGPSLLGPSLLGPSTSARRGRTRPRGRISRPLDRLGIRGAPRIGGANGERRRDRRVAGRHTNEEPGLHRGHPRPLLGSMLGLAARRGRRRPRGPVGSTPAGPHGPDRSERSVLGVSAAEWQPASALTPPRPSGDRRQVNGGASAPAAPHRRPPSELRPGRRRPVTTWGRSGFHPRRSRGGHLKVPTPAAGRSARPGRAGASPVTPSIDGPIVPDCSPPVPSRTTGRPMPASRRPVGRPPDRRPGDPSVSAAHTDIPSGEGDDRAPIDTRTGAPSGKERV